MRGTLSPTDTPHTGHPRALTIYLTLTTLASAATVVGAWLLWPFALSTTGVWLVLALGVVEVHSLRVRHSSRSMSVAANELVLTLAALSVPVDEVVWVAIGGALLGPVMLRLMPITETMRRASAARNVLNATKNIVGIVPLVGLVAWATPHGTAALVAAAVAGTSAYGLLTHLLVIGAVERASEGSVRVSAQERWESIPVALVLTAMAMPVAFVMRGYDPDWPIVLTITAAIVLVSRARMDQDHAAHQLASLIEASRRLASAGSVGELDERLRALLAEVLRCRHVQVVTAAPASSTGALASRLGDDGPWVVVRDPLMGARWNRLDQDVLDAVCALAAPERRRLHLLERVQEAERFTSLVLTTAGHDITNHLHAATMAAGTVSAWDDRLTREERRALVERTDRAVQEAANVLRDLVAVGSRGLPASTTAGDTALFVRDLSPNIHVSADNVRIDAPTPIVERALENLVRNAERHHAGDEPIEVTVVSEGDTVRIEVRDRGPGLDPTHVETLFRPFAQLADDRRKRGSLGLGLFIARGLAESVGGSLAYLDREGGGAVFVLTLRSADEDPSQRRKERVVLGPGTDRDPQAPAEPGLAGEVADEHPLRE